MWLGTNDISTTELVAIVLVLVIIFVTVTDFFSSFCLSSRLVSSTRPVLSSRLVSFPRPVLRPQGPVLASLFEGRL